MIKVKKFECKKKTVTWLNSNTFLFHRLDAAIPYVLIKFKVNNCKPFALDN